MYIGYIAGFQLRGCIIRPIGAILRLRCIEVAEVGLPAGITAGRGAKARIAGALVEAGQHRLYAAEFLDDALHDSAHRARLQAVEPVARLHALAQHLGDICALQTHIGIEQGLGCLAHLGTNLCFVRERGTVLRINFIEIIDQSNLGMDQSINMNLE